MSDGSIVVPQSQDHRLLYIGGDGSILGAFGRDGSGPGEFQIIVTLGLVGDTVWAWDGQQMRATLASPARELVRVLRLPVALKGMRMTPDVDIPGAGPLHLTGLTNDSTFLGLIFASGGMSLVHAQVDGTVLETFPPLSTREDQHTVRAARLQISGNPFNVVSSWDVSQDSDE